MRGVTLLMCNYWPGMQQTILCTCNARISPAVPSCGGHADVLLDTISVIQSWFTGLEQNCPDTCACLPPPAPLAVIQLMTVPRHVLEQRCIPHGTFRQQARQTTHPGIIESAATLSTPCDMTPIHKLNSGTVHGTLPLLPTSQCSCTVNTQPQLCGLQQT